MESNVPIYLFNQPRTKTLLVQKWQELMRLRVIREPIGGMTRHYMGESNSPSIFQTTRRTSYVLRYVNPAQLTFARTNARLALPHVGRLKERIWDMAEAENRRRIAEFLEQQLFRPVLDDNPDDHAVFRRDGVEEVRRRVAVERSEEHTSELQSLMRISYAVFCL